MWRGKKWQQMSIHGSTEDLTATDLPLPGLLPTPVPVADEVEHFMEVCAQSNLLSLYLPLVSLQPMEQDGGIVSLAHIQVR